MGGNMKPMTVIKRYLVPILTLLVIFVGGRRVASRPSEMDVPVSLPEATPSAEITSCRPGDGWRWANGPSQPEIAESVRQALDRIGIDALVYARSYGETDSCGTFVVLGVDFDIEVNTESNMAAADRQELANRIYPVLMRFGKPNLGRVKITFLPDNTVLIVRPPMSMVSPRPVDRTYGAAVHTNWRQIITDNSPSARYTHGLAYDSSRSVAFLFGGDDTGFSRLSDTWEFDGANWTQTVPSQSPPGRANIDQALVYDSNRRRVVLFGGLGTSGYLSDTWEYDGTTWAQVNTATSPSRRDSHAMVFDSGRNVTVLFGGYSSTGSRLDDTWEYNGIWYQVTTPQTPPGRYHHSMAYDERRGVVVLFGGLDSNDMVLGDTWEYDGSTWREVTPAQSPPARHNHSMTYDSARGVIVLFGGEDENGLLTDTWEYDGTTWQQITVAQTPSPRKEMPLIFDRQEDRILLFGGGYWEDGSLISSDETWEYTATLSYQVFMPLIMRSYVPFETFHRKVYVIVYDPILSNGQYLSDYLGWNDYSELTQGTTDFFRRVTDGRLNYTIVYTTIVTDGWPVKIDGFRYTEEEYLAVINGQSSPHTPDTVDYNVIVNSPDFDICGKANRGEIDEVWIYNGPYFGFYESTLVGPGAYWYNSPPVPEPYDCNRLIPIMGPSPERDLDNAIHNFGHRTESTMKRVYGGWENNRTAHNWERFALVKALSPDYFYSGCGNIHYPPNGTSDYDYANLTPVLSNCDDFVNYPDLGDPAETAKPVDCSAWGCDQIGYLEYWFSHLPSNYGCGPDEVSSDWWKYFVDPALALDPSSPCQ